MDADIREKFQKGGKQMITIIALIGAPLLLWILGAELIKTAVNEMEEYTK